LSLNDEEHVMSGLTGAILLIVGFLVLVLVLRIAGRRTGPKPSRDAETDD
jgi:hypothetical protein